jgi:hypothetical protein
MLSSAEGRIGKAERIVVYGGKADPDPGWRGSMSDDARVAELLQGARSYLADAVRDLRDAARSFRPAPAENGTAKTAKGSFLTEGESR